MKDEDKLHRDLARAQRVETVWTNDLKPIFESLERRYLEEIANCAVPDDEGRRAWALALRSLREVNAHVRKLLDDGKIAQAELDSIRRLNVVK